MVLQVYRVSGVKNILEKRSVRHGTRWGYVVFLCECLHQVQIVCMTLDVSPPNLSSKVTSLSPLQFHHTHPQKISE